MNTVNVNVNIEFAKAKDIKDTNHIARRISYAFFDSFTGNEKLMQNAKVSAELGKSINFEFDFVLNDEFHQKEFVNTVGYIAFLCNQELATKHDNERKLYSLNEFLKPLFAVENIYYNLVVDEDTGLIEIAVLMPDFKYTEMVEFYKEHYIDSRIQPACHINYKTSELVFSPEVY